MLLSNEDCAAVLSESVGIIAQLSNTKLSEILHLLVTASSAHRIELSVLSKRGGGMTNTVIIKLT